MIKQVLDRSSRKSELSAAPVVVLVEHRDDVFARLKHCFTTAGVCVTRAKSSAGAIERYVKESADLLVVNADQTEGTAWLLAAKLRLTHPAARIWVYIRRPSTFDLDAANLLAIEELIEYGGRVADLQAQVQDRLGVSVDTKVPRSDSLTGIDPLEAVAWVAI